MVIEQTIDENDLGFLVFTDSVEEAVEYIHKNIVDKFGIKLKKVPKPSKILLEKKV
jgi:hypothetical protein